jgi:DNA-binding FrmR family transcriptional regulator
LDNNDECTGSSRTELSPEIVQEFQVVNNGLSAESGGASGGSIKVITRSGTNTIHGDAFLFAQDGALNARDPFETESGKPSFRRFRAGFALGGPVVKDRTFYYVPATENDALIDKDRTSRIRSCNLHHTILGYIILGKTKRMAHTTKDKAKLLSRVRRIRGQVDAIERALNGEQECSGVLQLMAACRGALNGLMAEVLEGHIRFHVLDPKSGKNAPQVEAAEELIDVVRTYLK